MTSASPAPPASRRRSRRPLVLAIALLALGVGAPTASAAGVVVEGSAADAPLGDAPSTGLDIVSANAVFNRTSGKMKATVQMANRPPGDVDIQYGTTQPGGACVPEVTLRTNVAMGKAQLFGSAGAVRKDGKVVYKDVGVVAASVADENIGAKGRIDCFFVRSYGAGPNHQLRDTLGPVPMPVRTGPAPPCDPEIDDDGCSGTVPPCDSEVMECPAPVCPDPSDCTDTTCSPEDCPVDPCDPGSVDPGTVDPGVTDTIPVDPGTGGDVPAEGRAAAQTDGCPPVDPEPTGPQLSVRFYGLPKSLKRGRTYTVRIRIRNDTDARVGKLKVRLTKKTGVSLSRLSARVSKVSAGKGVTVRIRVRLSSSQAKRTVRVAVTGSGVSEKRSLVLRRRGAK